MIRLTRVSFSQSVRATAFDLAGSVARANSTAPILLRSAVASVGFAADDPLDLIFRHRYLLSHYVGLSLPTFVAVLLLDPGMTERASVLMPAVVLGLVAMLWTVGLYVNVMKHLARRAGGAIVIGLTPALMIGSAVHVCVLRFYALSLGVGGDWNVGRTVFLFAVLWIYAELAAVFILRGPVRRAKAEMKARAPVETMPPAAAAMPVASDAVSQSGTSEPVEPILQGVLRLAAQGNHVLVVTERGQHLLPGPFGPMVARLPDAMGRQVHRSHWVAFRAVARTRRKGRDVFVETVDGACIPVASAK